MATQPFDCHAFAIQPGATWITNEYDTHGLSIPSSVNNHMGKTKQKATKVSLRMATSPDDTWRQTMAAALESVCDCASTDYKCGSVPRRPRLRYHMFKNKMNDTPLGRFSDALSHLYIYRGRLSSVSLDMVRTG